MKNYIEREVIVRKSWDFGRLIPRRIKKHKRKIRLRRKNDRTKKIYV